MEEERRHEDALDANPEAHERSTVAVSLPRPGSTALAASPDRVPLAPGSVMKQYEIVRELGRGGMGRVFLARDTRLARRCAIKLVLEYSGARAVRFLAEARATARCEHENIVTVYEADEIGGYPYMVLEYLEGRTLRAWMTERAGREPVPPRLAVELVVPVVRALACAHALGIVHRDLKPENIFLTDAGQVKVLDFGVAKQIGATEATEATEAGGPDASAGASARGALIGTPPYMAPEQWLGAEIDPRADLWALGIILYEMVTGTHPFTPATMQQLLEVQALDRPMPSVYERRPDVGSLGEVIDRCLQKRRDERFGSAAELLAALEAQRRRRRGVAGATAALGTSAIGVSYLALHARGQARRADEQAAPIRPPVGSLPDTPRPSPDTPGSLPSSARAARRRSRALRWAMGGGLAGVVAVTAGVLATRSSGPNLDERAGQTTSGSQAGLPTPQELRDHHRATIARRDAATLGLALAPAVFAIGPEATELAYGPAATRELIARHIDRIPIGQRDAPIGQVDGVAWWIEIGSDRQIASSTIAVAAGQEWRIAAWKLAYLVPNPLAAKLAAANKLQAPAEIVLGPDPAPAPPAVETAFRTAMSSRSAFVEAFSKRGDAVATGTAPNELMIGGKVVRAAFTRLTFELAVRGAITTGRITDRAAWAAANIASSMPNYRTQLFRVLALMLKEDGRWTIVLAHFSNAGPIGKL